MVKVGKSHTSRLAKTLSGKKISKQTGKSEEKVPDRGRGGGVQKISIQKITAEKIMILHLWVNGNAIKGYVVAKDGLEWKAQ